MKITGEGKMKGQIFSYARISSFIVIVSLFLGSCTETNQFTIGQDFLESRTKLQIVDTFRLDLTTVLLDSIVTNSKETGLVGNYYDDVFGKVKCDTYFDLAFPTLPDIEDKAVFDSAAFTFTANGYSYGDTTSLMVLSIHQLDEKIETYLANKLYNATTFEFSPEPLGIREFFPAPHSADTTIRIDVTEFGESIFELLRSGDESVSNQENFNNLIRGFVLTASNTGNNSVIGLKADAEHLKFVLYYHLDEGLPENKMVNLTMGETNHQFNNIRYDFSGSLLEDIQSGGNELGSKASGNKVFIQGSTGLMTRIQFPTLQDVLLEDRWKILKAELVIEPVKTSYFDFRLPSELYIYETNRGNTLSLINDSQGRPILPVFEYDEFFHENSRYTFEVTDFVNGELSDNFVNYEHGLMIGLNDANFQSSLERLVIEGRRPPVKLRLYYLTY